MSRTVVLSVLMISACSSCTLTLHQSERFADQRQKRLVAMLETEQHKQLIGKTVHDVTNLLGTPDKTGLDSDRSGWLSYYISYEYGFRLNAESLDFRIENGKVIEAFRCGIPDIPVPIEPHD